MGIIDEAAAQAAANLAGLRSISENQFVAFTLYVRWVLPLDGYVFWLSTGKTLPVRGSLHVTADKRQLEDETIAVNRVVLTTGERVQPFNEIAPDQMWVGEAAGVRFAFSRSGPRYQAAGIFHYNGDAVYPALANMLVPVGNEYPKTTVISSNSLPLWLTLKTYSPLWLVPPNPGITLYPSYLVPDNLAPPYGVVHIPEEGTRQLQATPLLGPTRPTGWAAQGTVNGTTPDATYWQLVADRVRVTLYGMTNQQAADFVNVVYQYSYYTDLMGIMSASPIRDAKRTQSELGIVAMKKMIEFEVSYYQTRVDEIARQFIQSARVAAFAFNDNPPITESAA